MIKSTNKPLISVISVVFNGRDYIERTIESIASQKTELVEYIIIDGGSSDGTVDIIFSRGDVIDHYVSEPDKGIYFAMNKGANIARGEYLSFLNASDIYYPKTLDLIVSVIKKKNIDYISAPVDIVNSSEKILSTLHPIKNFKYKEGSYMQMPAPHMSVFLKKNIFHELGGYDLSFKLSSDFDLLLRLAKKDIKPFVLKNSVGAFMLGGASGSYKIHFDNFKVLKKHKLPLIINLSKLLFYLFRWIFSYLIPGTVKYFIISKK